MRSFILLLFFAMLLFGCYYDVQEELYPEKPLPVGDTISYSTQIEPIINSDCNGCHYLGNVNSGSGIELETYDKFKAFLDVNETRFFCAIEQSGCASPMPKNGPKLSNYDIGLIKLWLSQGKQNN